MNHRVNQELVAYRGRPAFRQRSRVCIILCYVLIQDFIFDWCVGFEAFVVVCHEAGNPLVDRFVPGFKVAAVRPDPIINIVLTSVIC